MRTMLGALALFVIGCGPSLKPGGGDDGAGDDTAGPDAGNCAAESTTAAAVKRPSDIIWVIDNSGSMSEEEARVQSNMNTFAQSIANSGIDYHVVVLNLNINVPPPLGGSANLRKLAVDVQSHDALERFITNYGSYSDFLRPTALKHIIVVSDDESSSQYSKPWFEGQVANLTPSIGTDWKFHAVVAETAPFLPFPADHCFGLAENVGQTYLDLRSAHPGLFFSLCDTNWSPLFTALAQAVTSGGTLPCTFALPKPPSGQALDPSKVNFVYTASGGQPATLPNVGSAASCNNDHGWYYDNPTMPTQILTCPQTCATLNNDTTGKVEIAVGCATVIQ